MKVRFGFVTNSSSSSFIIAKNCGEIPTVESVYSKIRQFYLDMYEIHENILRDAISWKIVADDSPDSVRRLTQFWKVSFDKSEKFENYVKHTYGINLNSLYHDVKLQEIRWTDCESYAEFEEKFKGVETKPFIIVDYSKLTDEELKANWEVSGVISWYFNPDDYDVVEPDVTVENLLRLGQVGVHSESGYLAPYVVKRLSEISRYSCNHMG